MTEYDVVLLVEQALSPLDATQLRSLHEEIEEPVRYHLLVPIEDSASQIEAGLGAMTAGDPSMAPPALADPELIDELRTEVLQSARDALQASVSALEAAGGRVSGEVLTADPIDGLAAKVIAVDAREAIILTRPHVVREFFHVDWTSRARRKLGVPVLHLLEHETFDEQAGEGEGISGF